MNPDVVAFKASNRGHDSAGGLAPRFAEPRRMRIKFDGKLATRAATRVSEAYPGALFPLPPRSGGEGSGVGVSPRVHQPMRLPKHPHPRPLPTTRFARGGRGEEKLDIPRNAVARRKDGLSPSRDPSPLDDSPTALLLPQSRKSRPRNHPVSRFAAAGRMLLGIGFAS